MHIHTKEYSDEMTCLGLIKYSWKNIDTDTQSTRHLMTGIRFELLGDCLRANMIERIYTKLDGRPYFTPRLHGIVYCY